MFVGVRTVYLQSILAWGTALRAPIWGIAPEGQLGIDSDASREKWTTYKIYCVYRVRSCGVHKVACRSLVADSTIYGRLTLDACYAFRYSYLHQLPTYNLFSLCETGAWGTPHWAGWGLGVSAASVCEFSVIFNVSLIRKYPPTLWYKYQSSTFDFLILSLFNFWFSKHCVFLRAIIIVTKLFL